MTRTLARRRAAHPTFGFATPRELHEADLFWADLVGEPARPSPSRLLNDSPVQARAVRPRVTVRPRNGVRSQWESFEQAGPATPTASPCDLGKSAETLDGFALDSAALTTAHRALIRTIAGCVVAIRGRARPVRVIRIVGFTDPSGSDAHNVGLGQRRAEAVRDALVLELNALSAGSAASITFTLETRGETEQVPGGPPRNRRVEVSVPLSVVGFAVHSSDTDTHEIASNLGAAGVEHFVCVKGTGNVVLEAELAPDLPGAAGARLRWTATGTTITAPAIGSDARTAKLSSTASGKFPVRLQLDGALARSTVVWVVWSSVSVTATRAAAAGAATVTTSDGVAGPGLAISAGIDHSFTIEPAAIITDADRPALEGPRTVAVPGDTQTHVISGNTLAGGAGTPLASSHRWDVSRQIRVKIENPRLYPVARLSRVAGHLWTGQPVASTIPENYPAIGTIGNDDTHDGDENDNPYTNAGVVTSTDDPTMLMRDSTGADGDTFERRYHFREFLRVNLGNRWYRASDYSLWRLHGRFRRVSGAWADNGSSFARNNTGF